jgi:hypothetical protein
MFGTVVPVESSTSANALSRLTLNNGAPLRDGDIVRRKGNCELVYPVASQLICKFLYLFFPRDIDDSVRIVVKAVAQESK